MNKLSKEMLDAMHNYDTPQARAARAREVVDKLRNKTYKPCAVCGGEIKAIIAYHQGSRGPTIGGPPAIAYISGQFCSECGVRYHKLQSLEEEND